MRNGGAGSQKARQGNLPIDSKHYLDCSKHPLPLPNSLLLPFTKSKYEIHEWVCTSTPFTERNAKLGNSEPGAAKWVASSTRIGALED